MTAFRKRPLAAVALAVGVGGVGVGVGVGVGDDMVGEAAGEAVALGLDTTSVGLASRGSSTMAAITSAAAAAATIAPRFM